MRGYELCQRFFEEIAEPVLSDALPGCLEQAAVGPFGGSQAHDNDDEVSRDHGWGPGLGICLPQEAFQRQGVQIQEILDELPQEFRGIGWSEPPPKTNYVAGVDDYLQGHIGFSHPPEDPMEWLRIPEEYLFEITPDRFFTDRAGIVTERFQEFAQYPTDVWRKRTFTWLYWVAEWGEKNLLRVWQRGQMFSADLYRSPFATAVMKVVFLLNRRYSPYHKWVHTEFGRLPSLSSQIDPLLHDIMQSGSDPRPPIQSVLDILATELQSIGVTPVPSDCPIYPSIMRDFARGLRASITDDRIREMPTYVDVASLQRNRP